MGCSNDNDDSSRELASKTNLTLTEYYNEQGTITVPAWPYLQERGVSFLLAGQDSLDCQTACQKLYRLFGIQPLLICGGGIVNWSFLQQGVVDEVSLVLAPAADGGASSAAVFQQSPFLQESFPVEFRLKTLKRLESDAVRLVYAVRQPR